MEYGITENEFWNMTLAELIRAVDAKKKIMKREAQEKAANNYILADLIGRSVSRIYSSTATLPAISEVYPSLFDSQELEEQRKQKQMELSALRFKQFAQSHNKKFGKQVELKNE